MKVAIESTEGTWTQNKPIIDTSKGGIRRSMVSNLPYFHVWFEPNKGIGHVIEDHSKWPEYFGRVSKGNDWEDIGAASNSETVSCRWHA